MYDVVIIGGGVAGVSAAVASAEMGAKTILIEKEGWLGGMPTGACVVALAGYYNGHKGKEKVVRGNFEKITDKAIKMGFAEATDNNRRCKPKDAREITIDPEGFKYVHDEVITDLDIDLYLHNLCWYLDYEENEITKLWITSKAGGYDIEGKIFIDCTGDADTAEWLNIPYTIGMVGTESITMGLRLGGIDTKKAQYDKIKSAPTITLNEWKDKKNVYKDTFNAYGWRDLKCKDAQYFDSMAIGQTYELTTHQMTQAEIIGRKYAHKIVKELKKYPGYENVYLISTGPTMGRRKTRHPITQYYLSDEDENCDPYDSIAMSGNVMKDYGSIKIPFRMLLPKKIKNLIYAGRCISPMYHKSFGFPENQKQGNVIAYELPRLVPCCMATGEAAGVAAAICAKNNMAFDKLCYDSVQEELKSRGAIF